MNINPVNNINFGQKHLSTINVSNETPLNFVEYEYGFYDMLHIRDQVTKWDSSKGEKGKNMFNRFCNHYMNGGYLKRYFGVEDNDGKIQAIIEADVQADKTNEEEFATIKPSKVAFSPDVEDMRTPEIKKGIKAAVKKHSDKCRELFAYIINKRTRVQSFSLDEDGNIQEKELELNA